jgi:hypothetical protein
VTEFADDLRAWARRWPRRVCYFLGHRWTVTMWMKVASTTAVETHSREHTCTRCAARYVEKGYKDARDPNSEIV